MDTLAGMRAFVTVVSAGSFAGAADRLRMSRAMITKQVAQLEKSLGTRLLHRTTRRLSLTEAGVRYHEQCLQILEAVADAEASMAESTQDPQGLLRIHAPMSFGVQQLAPALIAYQRRYPGVMIDLSLNDRTVDLVEEGCDVAIRIGSLTDSSLIAKRLGTVQLVVCAAPAYLEAQGRPHVPQDLATHTCLSYSYWSDHDHWRFRKQGAGVEQAIRVTGSLRANNGDVLRQAAVAGLGLILQPRFLVETDLLAGRLEHVLTEYEVAPLSVYAVYLSRRYVSQKVRSLIAFLQERYAEAPG
ncbi:MAG TPA: LysR family transcriptional regulator [Acidiferrobacteraceae bacterium]|nr:LysR family transcriptional regulator [Acidiferrobacteraceae bacterium]